MNDKNNNNDNDNDNKQPIPQKLQGGVYYGLVLNKEVKKADYDIEISRQCSQQDTPRPVDKGKKR